MTDERIIICDIVNGCADCPRMGDDCDGYTEEDDDFCKYGERREE